MARRMRPADTQAEIEAAKDRNRDENGKVVVVREHLKEVPEDKYTPEGYVHATGDRIVLSTGECVIEYENEHYHDYEECFHFNEGEMPENPRLVEFAADEEAVIFSDGEYERPPEERIVLLQNIPEYHELMRDPQIMEAMRKTVKYRIMDSVKYSLGGFALKYYRQYCSDYSEVNPVSREEQVNTAPRKVLRTLDDVISTKEFHELSNLDPKELLAMTDEQFDALQRTFRVMPATEYFKEKYGKIYLTRSHDLFDIPNEKLIKEPGNRRSYPIECKNLRDRLLENFEPMVLVGNVNSDTQIIPLPYFLDTELNQITHVGYFDYYFRRAALQCDGVLAEYGSDFYGCLSKDIIDEDIYLCDQMLAKEASGLKYMLKEKDKAVIHDLTANDTYHIRDFMEGVIVGVTKSSDYQPLFMDAESAEKVNKVTLSFYYKGTRIAETREIPVSELRDALDKIYKGDTEKLLRISKSIGTVVDEMITAEIEQKEKGAASRRRKVRKNYNDDN